MFKIAGRRFINVCIVGSLAASASCTGAEGGDKDPRLNVAIQAISLGGALGIPVAISGVPSTTCGLNNGVSPRCATSTASDISFGWTAPSAGSYTFSTAGSGFDTILVISPYNNPTTQLECQNAVSGTGGESITRALSAGEQILITIDGYAALCGNYQLNITKNCASACNSACQIGTCSIEGQCISQPRPAGTACDDFDDCTVGEVCNGAGACVGARAPRGTECSTGDPCAPGSCNSAGQCIAGNFCDGGCAVDSQFLSCNDGVTMLAWGNDTCGWCINRGVCDRHRGPTVCPR